MIDGQLTSTGCDNDITYVVGLWIVAGNTKRSREHYFDRLPATLRLLKNKRVIFLYDDDMVAEFAKQHLDTSFYKFEKISLSNMIEMTNASKLVEQAKQFQIASFARMKAEKGLTHYRRDLTDSGEQVYKQVLSIWLSKVFLVTDIAISKNPFQTASFAWVDASLSRLNNDGVNQMLREPVDPWKVLLARSGMRYKGKRLRFSAGFILATAENWQKLRGVYDRELTKSLNEPYPIDEEVLLTRTSYQNPDLLDNFKFIKKKRNMKQYITEFILDFYYQLSYQMFISISKGMMLSRRK